MTGLEYNEPTRTTHQFPRTYRALHYPTGAPTFVPAATSAEQKDWSALSESASRSSHGTPNAAHITGNIDAAPRLVAYDHESRRPMFAFILYILAALMVVIALVISSEASEPLQAAPLWGSAVVVGGLGVVAQLLQRLCRILKDIRAELQNRR